MKRKYVAVASALALPFVIGAFCTEQIQAAANSAPPYWEGTDASGAIVKGDSCPVVVEKESLTLNIETLPKGGNLELGEYSAEAIAEYSFYNPTDLDVDMTLLFPYGTFPSYAPEVANGNASAITVDGESAECRVRYSYAAYLPYEFNIDKDMARIRDEKKSDPFYAEDTPVSEYRLSLTVPEFTNVCPLLKIKLGFNPKKTRALFPSGCDTWLKISDGDMYACSWMRKAGEKSFVFYVAGEAPASVEPKLYADGGQEISTAISVTSTQTTFSEFVFSKREKSSEIGDTDWYNAFVDMLNDRGGKEGSVDSFYLGEGWLMHWFEYDMSIPAKGRAVNRVRAPLYPTVDGRTNSRYMYTYLLSPAGKWADFQKIDISINTPYYLSNGSLSFKEIETESGYSYQYSRDSLPQGELTFVLTEKRVESDITERGKNFLLPSLTWAFVTLFVLAAVAAIVTVIVVFSLRKKKK